MTGCGRKRTCRARRKRMKSAFLQNAADNAILFDSQMVNAKTLWERMPENGLLLAWKPVWAGIISEDKIGFTTGPFSFGSTKRAVPIRFGEYETVWKKQTDGAWKYVLGIGINHEKSTLENPAKFSIELFPVKTNVKRALWNELDTAFISSLEKSGLFEA